MTVTWWYIPTPERSNFPVLMRSSNLPGVPHTMSTPCCRARICSFALSPPITSSSLYTVGISACWLSATTTLKNRQDLLPIRHTSILGNSNKFIQKWMFWLISQEKNNTDYPLLYGKQLPGTDLRSYEVALLNSIARLHTLLALLALNHEILHINWSIPWCQWCPWSVLCCVQPVMTFCHSSITTQFVDYSHKLEANYLTEKFPSHSSPYAAVLGVWQQWQYETCYNQQSLYSSPMRT